MDLISRDKAQEIIPKVVLGMSDFAECIRDSVDTVFDNCPSAFEGMTTGEVLKAVLGIEDEQIVEAKYLVSIYPKGNSHDPFIAIKKDVWNAPYQKGGE